MRYEPIDEEPAHFGYGLLLFPFLDTETGDTVHM